MVKQIDDEKALKKSEQKINEKQFRRGKAKKKIEALAEIRKLRKEEGYE